MAGNKKFYGPVGYETSVEEPAGGGVWIEKIVERHYFGDVKRNTLRLDDGSSVNPDLSVGNSISIVADPYANENFHAMRYAKWNGELWEITSVEDVPDAPRLLLRLGGVYNGETPGPSEDSGEPSGS